MPNENQVLGLDPVNPEDEAILSELLVDDDVALQPGPSADSPADIRKYINPEVLELYEVYSYNHAAAILGTTFPDDLRQIESALLDFRLTMRDIGLPGGNESVVPKKFSSLLRPNGWCESRIQADLQVKMEESGWVQGSDGKWTKKRWPMRVVNTIESFIDGHKIDYMKGRIAFDLEWNSKDQTFDRDLYALRAFHECSLINAGVLVTRSAQLNPVFSRIPQLDKDGNPIGKSVQGKYGASTTWMGKLLYRLNAGRQGGCPVLVFGITPKLIEDWTEDD